MIVETLDLRLNPRIIQLHYNRFINFSTMSAPTTKEAADKINKILNEFGVPPLHGTVLADPQNASPEVVLAMVLDAMIKARPISHELTQRTIKKLIEADYHDIDVLSKSTWEDRTKVLQEGSYNRYREQCATNLGELAKLVVERYGTSSLLSARVNLRCYSYTARGSGV